MPKNKRTSVRISKRTAEIYDRRDACDAMRTIGISPMEMGYEMERSSARLDIGISAGLEAGIQLKEGVAVEEVLKKIGEKYSGQIPKIQEIISEKIREYYSDPENSGLVSSFDNDVIADIRAQLREED